jgi:hypothetical protein
MNLNELGARRRQSICHTQLEISAIPLKSNLCLIESYLRAAHKNKSKQNNIKQ